MIPVMHSAHRLNGILFILMIGAMLLYSLPVVWQFARSQEQAAELFADGKLLRAFERRYDRQFFLRKPAEQGWAALRYQLFDEGLPGVLIGSDGWLFSNQEYLVPSDLTANLDDQLQQIEQTRSRLAAAGKALVLLPVPMKADIYREHSRQSPPAEALALYERFVEALRGRGITTVALRDAFLGERLAQPLFMRQDSHWSPQGARLAAQQLAAQQPELRGETSFSTHKTGEKAIAGDLRNYLRMPAGQAPWLAEQERINLYETLADEPTDSADALFGERAEPIALVGTSYSKIDDWHFAGFLKDSLHSDLISMAVEAHGPLQAMQAFLTSPQLQDPDIHTVIWEYPLRTLLVQRSPSKPWQKTPAQESP